MKNFAKKDVVLWRSIFRANLLGSLRPPLILPEVLKVFGRIFLQRFKPIVRWPLTNIFKNVFMRWVLTKNLRTLVST